MTTKFLSRFAAFIVLPLITLEIFLRVVPFLNHCYIKRLDPLCNIREVNSRRLFIFYGSSRVAAAIVPEIIDKKLTNCKVCTINAGRGMTTSSDYFLSIKKLAEKRLLENSVIFLEAPGGLCPLSDNYKDYWVDDRNIHTIVPYINFTTLKEFWRYSKNNFSVKFRVTVHYFFYTARIIALFKEIFHKNSFTDLVIKAIKKYRTGEIHANITNRGGIKIDSADIKRARKIALDYAKSDILNQHIITSSDWNKSRLNDIYQLTRLNNCKLVIYEMPLSSVQAEVYKTEISMQNINIFKRYIDSTHITFIDLKLNKYSDKDFPDLWHISSEKACEYTNMLADSIGTLMANK